MTRVEVARTATSRSLPSWTVRLIGDPCQNEQQLTVRQQSLTATSAFNGLAGVRSAYGPI